MNRIKNIIFSFIVLLSGSALSLTVDLDGDGTITEYSATVNKLEIYNSTTGEWSTLADTAKTVNVASANAGAEIGSMVKSGLTLKYGTYTKVRVEVSGSFTLNACYDTGSTCTTGSAVTGNAHASVANNSVANRAATAVTVDFSDCDGCLSGAPSGETRTAISGGVRVEYTLTSPFVMSASTASMASDIAFDLDDKLTYVDASDDAPKYITPAFPGVTITVQ